MSLRKYTKEWLEELCKESYSYAEVLKKAGRKQGGGAQATLKQKINEFNIDVSHFTGQKWTLKPSWEPQTGLREKYSLEDIFKKNSFISQKVLRGYIERHNLLEYRCQNIKNSLRLVEKDNEHLKVRCPLSGDYLDVVGTAEELEWIDTQLSIKNWYRR